MSEGSGNRNGGSQVSTVDLMVIIIIVLLARIVIERVMPLFYESFGLYFGDFLFQTLSNYSLTFGALLGDILAVVLLVRFFPYGSGRTIVRSLVEVGAIALMAFLTSLLVRVWQFQHVVDGSRFFGRLFLFGPYFLLPLDEPQGRRRGGRAAGQGQLPVPAAEKRDQPALPVQLPECSSVSDTRGCRPGK